MNDINPANAVKNELTKIEQLKAMLENEGALYDENGNIDEQLIFDTIEGESNLHDMLLELEGKIAEYGTMQDAIKLHIDILNKRKTRMQRSAETLRTIILSAMDKAGIQKIEGALATLSVKNKAPSLIVTDESLIPSDYFELKPKLDKKAVTAALKDKISVPGAELDNGGISLMIRKA